MAKKSDPTSTIDQEIQQTLAEDNAKLKEEIARLNAILGAATAPDIKELQSLLETEHQASESLRQQVAAFGRERQTLHDEIDALRRKISTPLPGVKSERVDFTAPPLERCYQMAGILRSLPTGDTGGGGAMEDIKKLAAERPDCGQFARAVRYLYEGRPELAAIGVENGRRAWLKN